jgi:hypothetical protein
LEEAMGRKSLLQSTKKAAQKKKAAEKAVRAAAPAGTGVKTQSTSGKGAASVKEAKVTETKGLKAAVLDKKTVPAKKIATPKAAVAPKRDAAKPKIAAAPAKKVEVSLKDLLFKRFDTGGKVHPVEVKKAATQIPDAPPFVSGGDKKETERIRGLLFKAFRVVAGSETAGEKPGAAAKPRIAAAPAKKVEVSLKDLLFKRFDTGGKVHPVEVKKAATQIADAPPFVSGGDKKETERIRGLLFKKFALTESPGVVGKGPSPTAATPSAVKDIPPYKPASCPPGQAAGKGKKIALCALVALVAILLGASFSNQNNFYLKEKNGAVEVWRGKFAPAGEELLFNLDGMKLPEDVKNVYSKKEISPILFNFLQDKADALLDAPQGPDFGAVKGHLRQARDFAPTPMLRAGIESRLRGIDFMVLFYRADIALGKGTLPDLMAAKAYLGKALSFASTSYQRDLLAKMTTVADEAIAALPEK